MVGGRDALTLWDEVDRVGVSRAAYAEAKPFEESSDRITRKAFLPRCATGASLRKYRPGYLLASSRAFLQWNPAIDVA